MCVGLCVCVCGGGGGYRQERCEQHLDCVCRYAHAPPAVSTHGEGVRESV